jgi:hypothetical protein
MISEAYRAQVDLLLQVLPHVAKEESFAVKGGTAINLFVRDMPRLSVDIDLTWRPFEDRATALTNIADALWRIKTQVESAIPTCKVSLVAQSDGMETKLSIRTQAAQIKVEVNTTMRGYLLPSRMMDVADAVEDEFGRFVSAHVVSHAEMKTTKQRESALFRKSTPAGQMLTVSCCVASNKHNRIGHC